MRAFVAGRSNIQFIYRRLFSFRQGEGKHAAEESPPWIESKQDYAQLVCVLYCTPKRNRASLLHCFFIFLPFSSNAPFPCFHLSVFFFFHRWRLTASLKPTVKTMTKTPLYSSLFFFWGSSNSTAFTGSPSAAFTDLQSGCSSFAHFYIVTYNLPFPWANGAVTSGVNIHLVFGDVSRAFFFFLVSPKSKVSEAIFTAVWGTAIQHSGTLCFSAPVLPFFFLAVLTERKKKKKKKRE